MQVLSSSSSSSSGSISSRPRVHTTVAYSPPMPTRPTTSRTVRWPITTLCCTGAEPQLPTLTTQDDAQSNFSQLRRCLTRRLHCLVFGINSEKRHLHPRTIIAYWRERERESQRRRRRKKRCGLMSLSAKVYFAPERLKGWQRKNKGFPTLLLTDHPFSLVSEEPQAHSKLCKKSNTVSKGEVQCK